MIQCATTQRSTLSSTSLRTEGFRLAGPQIIAAAEGHQVELSRRSFFVAVAKSWLSAEAPPGTALAGRSAVLASLTTPSRIAELSDLLRADEVHAHVCAVEDAPALAEREQPMLVLLEDKEMIARPRLAARSGACATLGTGCRSWSSCRASATPLRMASMTGLPMFSWSPTRRIMRERGSGRGSCARPVAGCGLQGTE